MLEWLTSIDLKPFYELYDIVRPLESILFLILCAAFITSSTAAPTFPSALVSAVDQDARPIQDLTKIASSSQLKAGFPKKTEIPSSYGNFDMVLEPFSLDSAPIQVVKWKSRETGLTVVWAQVDGPIVHGYLTVATEIFNDSGVPHSLEHLIFFGSQKYPYQGSLANLANRSFGSAPGAWTDITHTTYTIETAGSQGFVRLLPLFLDHLFNPLLTPETFATEIHHINGRGESAGVLYCEMQSRENSSDDLLFLSKQRALYPPTSAYRSETGGLMKELRDLTLSEVQKFHASYYHSHNLQLIVTGTLDPTSLLEILQKEVEPSIIQHGKDRIPLGWKRPFLETNSKGGAILKHSKTLTIEFPAEDTSTGELEISWIGPAANDFLQRTALSLLGVYLTDSKLSPLPKRFIEIDPPFCKGIRFEPTFGEKFVWTAYLSSVPFDHLGTLGESFKRALFEEADAIDMDQLQNMIVQEVLRIKSTMEVDPHQSLSQVIMTNFVYGQDKDLVWALSKELERYNELAKWSSENWSKFFKIWLVDSPTLTVVGKPSVELSNKLNSETTQRIAETQQKNGPEGLQRLAQEIEHAQKAQVLPIPDHVLSQFPIPSLNSLKWINVEIAHAGGGYPSNLQAFIDEEDKTSLPYFLQFNHIKSEFLSIDIALSPPGLPSELLPLLPIYLNSFFDFPVNKKNGLKLSFEEFTRTLNTQTMEYHIDLGLPISQTIRVHMKVEKSKYAIAVALLRDLLWGSEFDLDRIIFTTRKAMRNIHLYKRNGGEVLKALYENMIYSSNLSPLSSLNPLNQESSLAVMLTRLKSEPQNVLKQMEQLRYHLLKVSSMRISVSGDIWDLKNPKSTWNENFETLKPEKLQKPLMGNLVLTPEGIKPSGKAILMKMASRELSNSLHFAQGPQGFDHPDRAALSLAIAMLTAMDGYLWEKIRGSGLAYGFSLRCEVEIGHISLTISESSDSFKAFSECHKVIKDIAYGKIKVDNEVLEQAKSSLIYQLASQVATQSQAVYEAFATIGLQGISPDFRRNLISKIKDIMIQDIIGVIKKYVLSIFDPKVSSAVVVGSNSQAKEIAQSLKMMGYSIDEHLINEALLVPIMDETETNTVA
ncbi:hypothetical protein O181_021719 [Austropuccinia psidii MF-1]|uniref:Mitochondrial presequence protease n=1 Tax=Austropuccinia psidii MF-1 TaxID=1389203 RepID=A0A9Q3GWY8_9BASI|nr:hypothetical protein [Austropuccinia psidii MF-1]